MNGKGGFLPLFWMVRLYFPEPEDLKPGQRAFDVALQDKAVLSDLDVVKEADGL